MKTNFTLTALICLLSITLGLSQQDVGLSSAQNNPAPYTPNEMGTISFIFSADNGVTLIPGETLKVTFSTANLDDDIGGVPYGDPIVDEFIWTYVFNSWVGTLDHNLPNFSGGTIKLDVMVENESDSSDPQHGFLVNLIPHAEDPIDDTNDEISAYTYTGALPVSLSKFEAKSNHCENVTLSWTTESEVNNKGFYIQRSIGSTKNFENIAFVDGNVNSTAAINYSYTDTDVSRMSGVSTYYRLHQVDLDGTSENSLVASARYNCERSLAVKIYPNPVVDELRFDIDGDRANIKEVHITNNLGQLVNAYDFNSISNDAIDVSGIAPGVYFIKVLDQDGTSISVEQIMKLQH